MQALRGATPKRQDGQASMDDVVVKVDGPIQLSDKPAAREILKTQVRLYVSTIQSHGTVADFGLKLAEHSICYPGRAGEVYGQAYKTLAAKIEKNVDEVIEEIIRSEIKEAKSISVCADEPRGIFRCGVRFTMCLPEKGQLVRRFYRLVELEEHEIETDGAVEKNSCKSVYSLWQSILKTLKAVVSDSAESVDTADIEKFKDFTPDGAATFGAAQAEEAQGVPEGGQNVAAMWQAYRRERGWTDLHTIHCAAHRGSLSNKDSLGEFGKHWQNLLQRQFWHFQESDGGRRALAKIVDDLGLPAQAVKAGSDKKWCGYVDAEEQDTRLWAAKDCYWTAKVAKDGCGDSESPDLWAKCHEFYSSIVNNFMACGTGMILGNKTKVRALYVFFKHN